MIATRQTGFHVILQRLIGNATNTFRGNCVVFASRPIWRFLSSSKCRSGAQPPNPNGRPLFTSFAVSKFGGGVARGIPVLPDWVDSTDSDSVEPQHLNSDSGEWIQGIQAKPQHLKFGFKFGFSWATAFNSDSGMVEPEYRPAPPPQNLRFLLMDLLLSLPSDGFFGRDFVYTTSAHRDTSIAHVFSWFRTPYHLLNMEKHPNSGPKNLPFLEGGGGGRFPQFCYKGEYKGYQNQMANI